MNNRRLATGPALAAITLDPRGGGIAAVARLLVRVIHEQWGPECAVETLVDDPGDPPSFQSSLATRVWFGTRLATLQVMAQCGWVFYSHLALAHVQRFVPSPARRPYAVFLHDIEAWGPLTDERRRLLAGAFLRLANSSYTARRVMDVHPAVGPVFACPLALDRMPGPRGSSAAQVPALGTRAVLIVGRMCSTERYKGHDQLLEAWPLVRSMVPDARLVFVGAGDDVDRLRAKAAQLGVGEELICPGFVSGVDLDALYRNSAVFAMPSRREGFGLVYLEAMTHGLPCIGSTHDASGDVIEDGVTGFLVDQADVSALADRITTLLTDDSKRQEMGSRGAARVAQHFTYEKFASRLVSLMPAEFAATTTLAARPAPTSP